MSSDDGHDRENEKQILEYSAERPENPYRRWTLGCGVELILQFLVPLVIFLMIWLIAKAYGVW